MTEKEFRKLSRAQYLEMMVEQGREIKRLKEELELAREEIKQKEIKIQKAGSIAEAAVSLNDVFGSAQRAADQYLESIRREAYNRKSRARAQIPRRDKSKMRADGKRNRRTLQTARRADKTEMQIVCKGMI